LKRLLTEQEALNRALLEKLNEREREIDHLQAQLDKLRRMNFGSRSEKVSRRIAQMEADLKQFRKKAIPLPVGWMTRPCSARCVRPAPANRSPNHSPVMKNGCCRQRHAARNVVVR
jgi:phage shock protein A